MAESKTEATALPLKPVRPIEYFGGVMDEETRPLLKSYIRSLEDGEGVIVVYRLADGTPDNVLLESNIHDIAGHDWDYVAGRATAEGSIHPMQAKVDKLSADAMALRVGNHAFTQGTAKVKAFDAHKICFGIVGNGSPVTSIKGIVHQQLNMGLNGDLLLHEGDIIIQSLIDNKIFHDETGRARPIKVKTYGAGGSASTDTNPGDMRVSDGVIDVRTHVDPRCIIKHLEAEVKKFEDRAPGVRTAEGQLFKDQVDKIKRVMGIGPEDREMEHYTNKDYTGIAMVHDIAELNRRAAAFSGETSAAIMGRLDAKDKRYYGEVTFGTTNTGVSTIYRMDVNPEGKPFLGSAAQATLVTELQKFLKGMSHFKEMSEQKEEKGNVYAAEDKEYAAFLEEVHDSRMQLEAARTEIQTKIYDLLKDFKGTDKDDKVKAVTSIDVRKEQLLSLENKIASKHTEIKQANAILERRENWKDQGVIDSLEQSINRISTEITILREEETVITKSIIAELSGEHGARYEKLQSGLIKAEQLENDLEKEFLKINDHYLATSNANRRLDAVIKQDREIYSRLFPGHEFGITGCGNLFFTETDKAAMGAYGAKTIEMENQLFVQIVNQSVANNLYIDSEFITKIAADPLKIEDDVTHQLNEWAQNHTMTVDDYVQAFMWANNGQNFSDIPESGRWTVAEHLFSTDIKCRERFYNFSQDPDTVKVINPFWKEIGTDLIKEILEEKAFQGSAFKSLRTTNPHFNEEKQRLKDAAQEIINNPRAVETQARVTALFTAYLNLMTPMQVPTAPGEVARFKAYARLIPVLSTGFVGSKVSDWDQPIYKSTNTAVLDAKSAGFLTEQKGKNIGGGEGGTAVVLMDRNIEKDYASATRILAKMIKLEKQNKLDEVRIVGLEYMALRERLGGAVERHEEDELLGKIKRLTAAVDTLTVMMRAEELGMLDEALVIGDAYFHKNLETVSNSEEGRTRGKINELILKIGAALSKKDIQIDVTSESKNELAPERVMSPSRVRGSLFATDTPTTTSEEPVPANKLKSS